MSEETVGKDAASSPGKQMECAKTHIFLFSFLCVGSVRGYVALYGQILGGIQSWKFHCATYLHPYGGYPILVVWLLYGIHTYHDEGVSFLHLFLQNNQYF